MDRKDFIKTCGFSCLGLIGLSTFLESCKNSKQITATPKMGKLEIPLSAFKDGKSGKDLHSVIINNATGAPIVLYKHSDTDIIALLMECTHQGVELAISGNILSCSAHGSEFDTRGNVITGPAFQSLKQFPVTIDAGMIYIKLS